MPRRGYTLVEMLVVISVSTVLLGAAVSMLYVLLRAEHGGREHANRATIVARLADQFRTDIHAARRPIPGDGADKDQRRFALKDDAVLIYRALPGEVERREEIAGKLVRQESYALPAGSSAEIVVRTDPAPVMAGLVITLPGPAPVTDREIRIDAVLGRDHRFTTSANGSP